ncbi:aldose epimerase [Stenomitos frigidus]|uniref:Aldose epimerase n=1 Tax=Stenomitos frigidus ULC18 TaxID=2107698 RepID=A0A2T1E565_9CYAN|nr:aldose epimerase [Stenomitos frigidus]PSB27879.1 aldose epimerase [Stenomitos frigidus ULC18]
MFAIAVEQGQYKTYTLSDSATKTSLEVIPERGGIVARWRVQGQDIFYLDEARLTDPALTVRGGIPILFPLCGNLPDNTYTHHGQPYTLKQHGFARELPWTVVDQSVGDRASLSLSLTSNDRTHAVYPFDFELTFTYTLDGNQLIAHQRYTNHSDEPMPFSAGFHPYFQVLDKTQLEVDIPADRLLDQPTKSEHPFSGKFDFEQDEIDVAFTNLSRQSASITDRAQGLRLTLTQSDEFSIIVFWTVKGKPFYCLEPWTAGRNAMNTGDRLIHLGPGASMETTFTLTAEFI